MKKHMIVVDLDGTLFKSWKEFDKESVDYLKSIKDNHFLMIATGRPYRSTVNVYKYLGLDTPIVNYNGALIQNPKDDNFDDYVEFLDTDVVYNALDAIDDMCLNYYAENYDDIYVRYLNDDVRPILGDVEKASSVTEGEFRDILDKPVSGLIILAKKGMEDLVSETIKKVSKGKLETRNWGEHYKEVIEVYLPQLDKWSGIQHIKKHYGLDLPIMCIGDGINDVMMIDNADIGVAMGNGVDEVKKVANVVIDSIENSGVKKYLEEYFKNNKE